MVIAVISYYVKMFKSAMDVLKWIHVILCKIIVCIVVNYVILYKSTCNIITIVSNALMLTQPTHTFENVMIL